MAWRANCKATRDRSSRSGKSRQDYSEPGLTQIQLVPRWPIPPHLLTRLEMHPLGSPRRLTSPHSTVRSTSIHRPATPIQPVRPTTQSHHSTIPPPQTNTLQPPLCRLPLRRPTHPSRRLLPKANQAHPPQRPAPSPTNKRRRSRPSSSSEASSPRRKALHLR